MAAIRFLIITFSLLGNAAVADTQQEIDHLLEFVASSDCLYERNGAKHSGPEARDHIRMKYEHYRKKVETAEDFIRYAATKSSISGQPYIVTCEGTEIRASQWLMDELVRFREK